MQDPDGIQVSPSALLQCSGYEFRGAVHVSIYACVEYIDDAGSVQHHIVNARTTLLNVPVEQGAWQGMDLAGSAMEEGMHCGEGSSLKSSLLSRHCAHPQAGKVPILSLLAESTGSLFVHMQTLASLYLSAL